MQNPSAGSGLEGLLIQETHYGVCDPKERVDMANHKKQPTKPKHDRHKRQGRLHRQRTNGGIGWLSPSNLDSLVAHASQNTSSIARTENAELHASDPRFIGPFRHRSPEI